ncbi:MAG: c-type cytochrome [Bacteroidia bacterium]|nr:c-type cytochrome [Bacteroidia bacterium]
MAILMVSGFLMYSGCMGEGKGFALPEGNLESGKTTFLELKCNACHSLGEITWQGEGEEKDIPLGGETTSIKTYGELVTSIINPSHKITTTLGLDTSGSSKMKVYNEVMTVEQLVDLVAFLKTEYRLVAPKGTYYPHYY